VCPQSVLHILLHFAKGHDIFIVEAAVVVDEAAPTSPLVSSFPVERPLYTYATLYLPIPHVVEEGHGVGATSLHTQNE
jgi:hypothetical protein